MKLKMYDTIQKSRILKKHIFSKNIVFITTYNYINEIFSKTLMFSGNIDCHTLNVSICINIYIKHFADNSESLNMKYSLYYKCITITDDHLSII